MIPVSTALKRACESDTVVYKEYIVIDEETVEIKGKMYNTAYKDTTFFGTFNMKMLKFSTENDVDYKGKEFEYYKSINGTAFKIGTYIVTEVKDSDTLEEVTVTAYDYGLKFANQYVTELDYEGGSVTLYDVAEECCTNCGVSLNNATITNGDFIVDSNQFVDSTQYGDVIAQIAMMGGCFATINEDDELEFLLSEITTTTDEINLTTESGEALLTEGGENIILDCVEAIYDYVELEDKRDTQPITSVSIGFSDITPTVFMRNLDLIAEYGEHWLRIVDCPFAYSTDKQNELITAIYNRVKGFRYSSFVADYSFKPYIQLGDVIDFENKDGERVHSIVLRIETDYDDIKLSAPSIINATVDYDIPDTALSIAKKASIKVDEANAEIELKVSADEIIASINLSPEAIVISADKVNLKGLVTITALESDYSSNTELASAGSTTINGGNVTTGTIDASIVNVSNINASNISTGTISTSRLDSDVITTTNLSAQTISADQITSGSIESANYVLNTSGTKISLTDGTIDTKNFKLSSTGSITSIGGTIGGWTIGSSSLSGSGTISGGTVSGSTISGGSISITSGSYYFNMGVSSSHPNASGLNLGTGGINFNGYKGINISGTDTFTFSSSKLTQVDEIHRTSSGNFTIANDSNGASLVLGANAGLYSNYASELTLTSLNATLKSAGSINITPASGNAVRVGLSSNISYYIGTDGLCYIQLSSGANKLVRTTDGDWSSKILKKNIKLLKKTEYEEAYQLLKDIPLYTYKHKYKNDMYDNVGEEDFGFILDEFSKIKNSKKFFKITNHKGTILKNELSESVDKEKGKVIDYQRFNKAKLIRYLMVVMKEMQNKIEKLEES